MQKVEKVDLSTLPIGTKVTCVTNYQSSRVSGVTEHYTIIGFVKDAIRPIVVRCEFEYADGTNVPVPEMRLSTIMETRDHALMDNFITEIRIEV